MTADELIAWRKRLGYNRTQAAAALGCHRNSIMQWEAGKTEIPKYIELACLWLATDWKKP